MEDGRTAANLLTAGDFMIKVDLEKAYYSVPLHSSSTKFFRFSVQGQCYEFLLPNGLNLAPRIFT